MATKIKLTDVRLSFPDLYEPVEYQKGDGKFRYNASFLVVPGSENDKKIKAAILKEAKETYGPKADKLLASFVGQSLKYCYLDGDLKEYDGYASMMALSSHRRQNDGPPGVFGNVIDPQTGKVVVLTPASGKPYAGCYVNATVEIYAQDGENKGIRCGLVGVQYFRDGDAFSGSKPASADDFEAVGEGADAESMV